MQRPPGSTRRITAYARRRSCCRPTRRSRTRRARRSPCMPVAPTRRCDMTPSESARATSAAEQRYRIDAPNSQPRAVKVIALDAASERVIKRIARGPWRRATFFTSRGEDTPSGAWSLQAWLGDVAGRAMDLVEEIASADLVVMVAAAGGSPPAASVIGEACALNHVMTTALIVGARRQPGAARARILAALCPYASMLVPRDGDDYIAAMLKALQA